MGPLPAHLDEELRRLRARASRSEANGREMVQLACDLLCAGVDVPAAVELATAPFSIEARAAAPLFNRMLVELDRPGTPASGSTAGVVPGQVYCLRCRQVETPQAVGSIPARIVCKICRSVPQSICTRCNDGALVVPMASAAPAHARVCSVCGPGDPLPPGASAALDRLRAFSPALAAQIEAQIAAALALIPDECTVCGPGG